MNLQKTCNATFKAIGDGLTKFTAIITTHAIDRDQDVVIPSGMNSKEYESNPVLLYSHDPNKPIGKMVTMRRGESSIDADFVLAPRPETHEGEWLPDTVGALMKFGALKGVSIGYIALDGGVRKASKEDATKYGTGVKQVYSKWKLLEVSVVSIPSNQEALINAVSKGIVSTASLKALGCEVQTKDCGTGAGGFQPGNECGGEGGGGSGGGGGSSSDSGASKPKPAAPKLNSTQQAQGKPPAPNLEKPKEHSTWLPRNPRKLNMSEYSSALKDMGYEETGSESNNAGTVNNRTLRDRNGNSATIPIDAVYRLIYANSTDPISASTNVVARKPRKYLISIRMPAYVQSDITDAAKVAISKMRGQFR